MTADTEITSLNLLGQAAQSSLTGNPQSLCISGDISSLDPASATSPFASALRSPPGGGTDMSLSHLHQVLLKEKCVPGKPLQKLLQLATLHLWTGHSSPLVAGTQW